MIESCRSNGKLLITAEYAVLDGALALAIPTIYGQSMEINATEVAGIHWTSYDVDQHSWFEGSFKIDGNTIDAMQFNSTSNTLLTILLKAKALNPDFLTDRQGYSIVTKLEFPTDWGLGSSSTLINNIATWAAVDPFELLELSFGGSGYDIAAARTDKPLLYQKTKGHPRVETVILDWNFKDQLFFVHLNHKQDSKKGIERYRSKKGINKATIKEISAITLEAVRCSTLLEFEVLMRRHEAMVSELIGLPSIKDEQFSDYSGMIKSLGAWGGDFVLVSGSKSDMAYFEQKGFHTILPFSEMIK
jgi:mevalonate kinase